MQKPPPLPGWFILSVKLVYTLACL